MAFGGDATTTSYQWREVSGVRVERHEQPFPIAATRGFPTSECINNTQTVNTSVESDHVNVCAFLQNDHFI